MGPKGFEAPGIPITHSDLRPVLGFKPSLLLPPPQPRFRHRGHQVLCTRNCILHFLNPNLPFSTPMPCAAAGGVGFWHLPPFSPCPRVTQPLPRTDLAGSGNAVEGETMVLQCPTLAGASQNPPWEGEVSLALGKGTAGRAGLGPPFPWDLRALWCCWDSGQALQADNEGPRAPGCPGGIGHQHRDIYWVGSGWRGEAGMGMVAPVGEEGAGSVPKGHRYPWEEAQSKPQCGGMDGRRLGWTHGSDPLIPQAPSAAHHPHH